jgi:Predicted metal-dependent phosphoesterases (PHP family)
VVITLLVLITAVFATDAIRDAVTLGSVGEGRLDISPGYLAIAPISNVLDTLTLLTVGQHIAILLTAIVAFIVVRVVRARNPRRMPTTVRREVIATLSLLVGIVLTYAVGALAFRPMARFVASDPLVLAIDFHAHTKYSHDGRAGWSEDDVRGWARGAGFDVVYITDHRTFEGGERGIASNPSQAGEGTMLLQGIEAFYKGEHVNMLSAGRRFRGITTPDLKDIDEQSLALARLIPQTSPVMIETMPGKLDKVAATTPGVAAIEIVDGSPRGLTQTRRDRARIVHLADSLNLALVTGSDNHGWGRAAPAWTLMRIPGWRGMETDSLSARIEAILRDGRRESTRPVERTVAGANNPLTLILSAPLVIWTMFATLGPDERVMWLVWTWGLVLAHRGWRRYRTRPRITA